MTVEGKGGRPQADIDWERVDELLISGCSGREIAGFFGLNPNTIYERCVTDHGITFTEYSQQKYAKGDTMLREVQFNKALEKDNTMLVWLGKNRLKQRDTPEEESHITKEQQQTFMELIKMFNAAQSKDLKSANNTINPEQ